MADRDWYQITMTGFMSVYRAFPYEVVVMADYPKQKTFTYRSSIGHLMQETEKMKWVALSTEKTSPLWRLESIRPNQNCTEILSVLKN